jgi:hypothetical protein
VSHGFHTGLWCPDRGRARHLREQNPAHTDNAPSFSFHSCISTSGYVECRVGLEDLFSYRRVLAFEDQQGKSIEKLCFSIVPLA